MALVTGTDGDDFIHRMNDGRVVAPGYTDVTGTTSGDDSIVPGGGADIVFAGSGNDTMFVEAVADISGLAEYIDGGDGNDRVRLEFSGVADLTQVTFVSVEAMDVLPPSGFLEVIMTAEQISSFRVLGGASMRSQVTLSAPGSVIMHASGQNLSGLESMYGSAGNDDFDIVGFASQGFTIDGMSGDDVINFTSSGHGTKAFHYTLSGGEGNDRLVGHRSEFTLDGGAGNDKLTGDKRADLLDGGDGKDMLVGRLGQDSLTGGLGADRFVFTSADDSRTDAADSILDFSHAQGDRIDLSKIDANGAGAGDPGFRLGGAAFSNSAGEVIQFNDGMGHTLIQGDLNGDSIADFSIQLDGAPILTSGDFIF